MSPRCLTNFIRKILTLSLACVEPPACHVLQGDYAKLWTLLDRLHKPSVTPGTFEDLAPYVASKRVAFVTDIPYVHAGKDSTSGPGFSVERCKVRGFGWDLVMMMVMLL